MQICIIKTCPLPFPEVVYYIDANMSQGLGMSLAVTIAV